MYRFIKQADEPGITVETVLFFVVMPWQDTPLNPGHEDDSGTTDFTSLGYNPCTHKTMIYQMKALLDSINSVDFVQARPTKNVVAVTFGDKGYSDTGKPGKEYTIYVNVGLNTGILLQLVACS